MSDKENTNTSLQEKSALYRQLMRPGYNVFDPEEKLIIRKAFDTAVRFHGDALTYYGEPTLIQAVKIAIIASQDISLGKASIIASLLYNIPDPTALPLKEIEQEFGRKAARIIEGVRKIPRNINIQDKQQGENYRKMLLMQATDIRVIFILLSEKLHIMRSMEMLTEPQQTMLATRCFMIYAPLAHRLGLYSIKSELEDLALKVTQPQVYRDIANKLQESKASRNRFIREFIEPLAIELDKEGFAFSIKGRPKSIFSIWNKMRKQKIPFEQVYDLFAIRIVIDSLPEKEKTDCWRVYSIITSFFKPNPERLRDWISAPKENGYESLHITVLGPRSTWVEVQIRSKRMDEIAEKGIAAHWKYKEASAENKLDHWLARIRDVLENADLETLDKISEMEADIVHNEIFVFTPKGEIRTLPARSTVLDFAFEIHSGLGERCVGARVNRKLVSIGYMLQNGDAVEIVTNARQKPSEDWLKIAVTTKARNKIRSALNEFKRLEAEKGREILLRKLSSLRLQEEEMVQRLVRTLKLQSATDLFYLVSQGKIEAADLKQHLQRGYTDPLPLPKDPAVTHEVPIRQEKVVLGGDLGDLEYRLSPCCSPVPGDDIFGYVSSGKGITVHRTNCANAAELLNNYAHRIVEAHWSGEDQPVFVAAIRLTGKDRSGLVSELTSLISNQLGFNIRSIAMDSNEMFFNGVIKIFVRSREQIDEMCAQLLRVEGIHTAERIDPI